MGVSGGRGRKLPAWKRDKIKVTVRDPLDHRTHYAYTTAERALCGILLIKNKHWAFMNGSGQEFLAECNDCKRILARFVELGLESKIVYGHADYCHGITRKGKQCSRPVVPGTEWCPSHSPAARLYAKAS